MDRAEKRYFKLFTGRHMLGGHSNHQLLFDAIAAMEEYDENALLQRFKDAPLTNRFAVTKRRLYETILKSLDAYHAESSVDARLYRTLHHVELLFQRALYEDASKVLQSARKLARQAQKQPAMLAVLQWERRLMEVGNYGQVDKPMIQQLARESEELLAEQRELDSLWALKSEVLMDLYRQGQTRNEQGLKEMRALMDHPLLRSAKTLRTARARFLYHHVHGAAAFATGALTRCIDHLSANHVLLEEERERFQDEPNLILSTLSNLIVMHVRLGHYEEAFSLLHRFRTLPEEWKMPETGDLDLKLFSTSTSLELTMHTRMGAFSKALELVPSVERGLAQHGDRLGAVRKAGLYYQVAYAYFGAGRPDLALKWSQRLLNDVHIDESAEIGCFGRLLNLLAHIDSGETDLLPYAFRSTERYLETRQRLYRFEPIFLDMVKAVMKAKGPDALALAYQAFLERSLPLEQDPMEHAVFDHLDPIAWAQSKIQGRTFAELVSERALSPTKAA
ncbi:MAG: hypothetical protein KDC00_02060 [Flavobacteriales bacterium]|nr:hypothetical protein [Flavobacteriales bacterium]MCB0769172.1 hypothetical protein [Flavobacteriales bacterium]